MGETMKAWINERKYIEIEIASNEDIALTVWQQRGGTWFSCGSARANADDMKRFLSEPVEVEVDLREIDDGENDET